MKGNKKTTKVKNLVEYSHFSMVRNFHLADLFTLSNGVCGMTSILYNLNYLINNHKDNIIFSMFLLFVGGLFDLFDGKIARHFKQTSLLGQELDTLCDLISFGVAPSVIAFTIGLRGKYDKIILVYFVLCGVARLARFNATIAILKKGDKVTHFEGTPIPTSLVVVLVMFILFYLDYKLVFELELVTGLHAFSILFLLSGSAMISRSLKMPKF